MLQCFKHFQYNPMTRVATDHGVLDQDMSGICRVDCGNIDCDLYIRCLIIIGMFFHISSLSKVSNEIQHTHFIILCFVIED